MGVVGDGDNAMEKFDDRVTVDRTHTHTHTHIRTHTYAHTHTHTHL